MAAPAHEMPESKGCGNKSDNNKPGVFTTPAIEQQPQTLDGCGKPTEADFPTDTAHTPDPSLKDSIHMVSIKVQVSIMNIVEVILVRPLAMVKKH